MAERQEKTVCFHYITFSVIHMYYLLKRMIKIIFNSYPWKGRAYICIPLIAAENLFQGKRRFYVFLSWMWSLEPDLVQNGSDLFTFLLPQQVCCHQTDYWQFVKDIRWLSPHSALHVEKVRSEGNHKASLFDVPSEEFPVWKGWCVYSFPLTEERKLSL